LTLTSACAAQGIRAQWSRAQAPGRKADIMALAGTAGRTGARLAPCHSRKRRGRQATPSGVRSCPCTKPTGAAGPTRQGQAGSRTQPRRCALAHNAAMALRPGPERHRANREAGPRARTTNSSDTAGRTGRRWPDADTARTTRRNGGRFVPASTDSELSVTFMSLPARGVLPVSVTTGHPIWERQSQSAHTVAAGSGGFGWPPAGSAANARTPACGRMRRLPAEAGCR